MALRREVEYCMWDETKKDYKGTDWNIRGGGGGDWWGFWVALLFKLAIEALGFLWHCLQPEYSYAVGWRPAPIDSSGFASGASSYGAVNPSAGALPEWSRALDVGSGGVPLQTECWVANATAAGPFALDSELFQAFGAGLFGCDEVEMFELLKYTRHKTQDSSTSNLAVEGWHVDLPKGDKNELGYCVPGSARVRWLVQRHAALTVVGQLQDEGGGSGGGPPRLGPLEAAGGRKLMVLAPGRLGLKEAMESFLPFWSRVGFARAFSAALAAGVSAVLFGFPNSPFSVCRGEAAAARIGSSLLVLSTCSCGFGVWMGLLWCAIYGIHDWTGQETSMPQLQLLGLAGSGLVLQLALWRPLAAGLDLVTAPIGHLLTRVNSGFYRIDGGGAAATAAAAQEIHRRVLRALRWSVVALVMAVLIAGLGGGAAGSRYGQHIFQSAAVLGLVALVTAAICAFILRCGGDGETSPEPRGLNPNEKVRCP
jgi:hypothetical protein